MYWSVIILLLISPLIGGLLAELANRVAVKKSLFSGGPVCDLCHAALSTLDTLPIAGWLLRRGKCRHCGGRISRVYLWTEIGTTAFALALWPLDFGIEIFSTSVALSWYVIFIACLDAFESERAKEFSAPLLVLGLIATWYFHRDLVVHHVVAAAGMALFFFLMDKAWQRFRDKRAADGGDLLFLAIMGIWIGTNRGRRRDRRTVRVGPLDHRIAMAPKGPQIQ